MAAFNNWLTEFMKNYPLSQARAPQLQHIPIACSAEFQISIFNQELFLSARLIQLTSYFSIYVTHRHLKLNISKNKSCMFSPNSAFLQCSLYHHSDVQTRNLGVILVIFFSLNDTFPHWPPKEECDPSTSLHLL